MAALPEPEYRIVSQINTNQVEGVATPEPIEPHVDLDSIPAFAKLPHDIQAILRQRIRRDMPAYRYLAK